MIHRATTVSDYAMNYCRRYDYGTAHYGWCRIAVPKNSQVPGRVVGQGGGRTMCDSNSRVPIELM